MLIKDLVDFGLSEKEAKVYIALLELEIAPVNEVAKASGINRSSTYVVLEGLKKKGLVSVSDDKNIRQYIATSPEILANMAETQAEKHERVKKSIHNLVPELKALFKGTKKKPLVKVFEGPQGLLSAYADSFTSKEKLIRVSSSSVSTEKKIPEYMVEYVKKRYQAGLRMKGIHPIGDMFDKLAGLIPAGFDEMVAIPRENFSFTADLAIYDNKIGYISNDEGIAIVIESKEMADVMKSVFDLAFNEAKRLGDKSEKNKAK